MSSLGPVLLLVLAIAAGTLVFFAWLSQEMLEGDTRAFDDIVRNFVHQYSSPAMTSLMRLASVFGSTSFLALLGLCVAIGFAVARWHRAVALFGITMAGGLVLDIVLKSSFHRARPESFFNTPVPNSFSFPSGHALLSFCFYGVLALIVTNQVERRVIRIVFWIGAALLTILIGISRIYLGVHYPSDVVAGYAAALVWLVAIAFGNHLVQNRHRT